MAEALVKKKRIRAGHKGSATKTVRQITDVLAGGAPDRDRLSLLRITLKEKVDTIKTLDAEIVELIEGETELADEIEQADTYKETLYECVLKVDRLLNATPPTPDAPITAPVAPPTDPRVNRIKLPKLQLRSFNGDLTRWTAFWESFESAVHNNVELSEVEKFNYLNSLLERSAREAISGLALTAANYGKAIETLKKRFGCKQLIVNKHMDALLQVEAVTSSQNTRALRKLLDGVNSHIHSLQSLGVEQDSYSSLLCPVLVGKLPSDLRLLISRKVSDGEWKLNSLIEAIEAEVSARERIGVEQSQPPARKKEPPPSATSLVSGGTSGVHPPCCYCNKPHLPINCDVISEVEARKQALRHSGRCFSCLRKGHLSRDCRSRNRCRTCGRRHHSSICGNLAERDPGPRRPAQHPPSGDGAALNVTNPQLNPDAPVFTSTPPTVQPPTTSTMYVGANKMVLLQTAVAEVTNPRDPSRALKVGIVFDGGSQKSYLTQRVKDKLALTVDSKKYLSIAAFGSRKGRPKQCEVVRLAVQTKRGDSQALEVFVVPHICDPITSEAAVTCVRTYSHLSQLDLADITPDEAMEVDLLIGSDFYWEFVTGETVRGGEGPVAIKTTLGWVLSGPTGAAEPEKSIVSLVNAHALRVEGVTNRELDETLRSFWELESLGVERVSNDPASDHFSSTLQRRDGRYEVSLPWREHQDSLPDNYDLSRRRLYGLLKRLQQNPEVLREYDSIICDQLERGIIEEVGDSEVTSNVIHYLPHHAVIRQDKETTKVRVVYDASARSSGPSLNDCLYTGPKFNQRILEILLRFRSYPVAFIADIEKAFLMISVNPRDRDVLRFLWVRDPFSKDPKIIVLRFTRVIFGVSASPFLLNATIKHHIESYAASQPEIVRLLARSIYVDDVVCGADQEPEAYTVYASSKEILSHGCFNLRKFVTNAASLQALVDSREATGTQSLRSNVQVTEADETYVEATFPTSTKQYPAEHKVLGVRWNIPLDQLVFSLDAMLEESVVIRPTKRVVISLIARIYDPLGFLSPVTVCFKVLMQELCKNKLGWDQQLNGEVLAKWTKLVDQLKGAPPITLPRCCLQGPRSKSREYRLCGFCDASTAAYAAVVYLVEEDEDHTYSHFVASKTRVSPLKPVTIPRLELLSALCLARLMSNVTKSLSERLSLGDPRCFTDSQVALFWIRGVEKDWKPFVQHRVEEIRKLIAGDLWNHCPGKENPADLPSRGMTPVELATNQLWKHGPEWLRTPKLQCTTPCSEMIPESCLAEMKAPPKVGVHSLLTPQLPCRISNVVDIKRFSSIHKLLHVTAYVLRFVRILKGEDEPPELTVNLLSEAERRWIIDSQSTLEEDPKFPSWRMQFGLFKDTNHLWRCGGRLQNANISFSSKHPILLHKEHALTTLIVQSAHQRVQHNGVKETLGEIRGKYWIVQGRSLVRAVIHKCVTCKRFEGKHFSSPPAPPLPSFRVTEAPPFTYTAVDFAGPVYVGREKGKEVDKVWICLFTCCVTRAIHLDLVRDMSTATFIRALKRFSARRGLPKRILSDNAKTFKAAAKLLKTIFDCEEVKRYLSNVGVEWMFNLEKAPWWGGVFERMVQSTKRCLRKVIGQARFSFDELHTVIVEIEGILNSRPISYLNSDDMEEPLTPSHLLVGRRILNLPDNLAHYEEEGDEEFEITTEVLQRRAKHLSNVLNHFWKRWSKEYLLELRDAHRQKHSTNASTTVKVGDVVLVHDQDHPRGFWKMAKVQKLLTGRDGQTRGTVLKVANKNGKHSTLQRPVQRIYPLGVTQFESDDEPEITDHTQKPEERGEAERPTRPQRDSALRARDRVRAWTSELMEDDEHG